MQNLPVRYALLALWLAVVNALSAQPAQALRVAGEQLFSAGSYSWRESRQNNFNDRKSAKPYGFGRTVIDGFTIATIIEPHNMRAVFHGPRTAFETRAGWRRTIDFTNDEIMEVFNLPASALERSSTAARYRNYTHAMFHEILRLLFQDATNIREEDGAIVGNIANRDFELYVSSGIPPRTRVSPFGLNRATPPRFPPGMTGGASFRVWLVEGKISKCMLDFSMAGTLTQGAYAGKEFASQRVFTYEILEIGTTRVDIGPEIAAVFNDVVHVR